MRVNAASVSIKLSLKVDVLLLSVVQRAATKDFAKSTSTGNLNTTLSARHSTPAVTAVEK